MLYVYTSVSLRARPENSAGAYEQFIPDLISYSLRIRMLRRAKRTFSLPAEEASYNDALVASSASADAVVPAGLPASQERALQSSAGYGRRSLRVYDPMRSDPAVLCLLRRSQPRSAAAVQTRTGQAYRSCRRRAEPAAPISGAPAGSSSRPAGVDPGMKRTPPASGARMPVIPSPGAPGGDRSITPKSAIGRLGQQARVSRRAREEPRKSLS